MKLRLPAVVLAASALMGGLLAATPAEAASASVFVSTTKIGFNTSGESAAYAKCGSSKTCKGSVYIVGDTRKTNYSIPARSGKYISLRVTKGGKYDPYAQGTAIGEIKRIANAKVRVAETGPKKITHDYSRSLDTRLPGSKQQIRGAITGAPGSRPVTDVKVRLIEKTRGGVERLIGTRPVVMVSDTKGGYTSQDDYSFNVAVDGNNSAVKKYYLKIEGVDSKGDSRSWWWRGSDDTYYGGSRYSLGAASVTAGRYHDFVADFNYGHLSGSLVGSIKESGVDISVAAPPTSYGSSRQAQELDITRCANVFARTKTDNAGKYRVDFLPLSSNRANENRYMVGARSGSDEVWAGDPGKAATGRQYGSCYDATGYKYSTANLVKLTGAAVVDLPLSDPVRTVKVYKQSMKFSGATYYDRWITIRERIPGLAILDSPVVAEGKGTSASRTFTLPQGQYWVESGRRLSCSAWYRSYYPNNTAYFNGADRGAERWKTVAGKYPEYKKSYTMGYKPKNPGGKYKGWMYRGYCGSYSAGTINGVNVTTANQNKTLNRASKGATVTGKVKRTGGRTNKEMMVRLSKSNGTTVLRTDLTDGGGKFSVKGLASGKYTISVNTDSWRGIGRTFSGKHTITVKAGKSYSAGTLKFKG